MIRIYNSPNGGEYSLNFTHAIANGAAGGSVSFTELPNIPDVCQLTVECPATGVHITAAVVAGTRTTTGFDYTLSGLTTDANYLLHVTLKYTNE